MWSAKAIFTLHWGDGTVSVVLGDTLVGACHAAGYNTEKLRWLDYCDVDRAGTKATILVAAQAADCDCPLIEGSIPTPSCHHDLARVHLVGRPAV